MLAQPSENEKGVKIFASHSPLWNPDWSDISINAKDVAFSTKQGFPTKGLRKSWSLHNFYFVYFSICWNFFFNGSSEILAKQNYFNKKIIIG